MKRIIQFFILAWLTSMAHGQAVQPLIQPHQNFVDGSGKHPCAGCALYSYAAGTTTPQPTYTDVSGLTQNTNPIILDPTGSASIWVGNTSYKFVLQDTLGTVLWTVDSVLSPLPGNATSLTLHDITVSILTAVTVNATTVNATTVNATRVNGTTVCGQVTNGTWEATCFPGVDPTGVSDSTAGIQSAIWAAWGNTFAPTGTFPTNTPVANVQYGGGKVHLGKGKYKTSGTLWIPPHVTLSGDGEPRGVYSCADTAANIGAITLIDYEPSSAHLNTFAVQNASYNIVTGGACTHGGGCAGTLITNPGNNLITSSITGTFGPQFDDIGLCTTNTNGTVQGGILFTGAPESTIEHESSAGFQQGLVHTGGWVSKLSDLRNFSGSSSTYVDFFEFGTRISHVYGETYNVGSVGMHINVDNGAVDTLTVDWAPTAYELGGTGTTISNVYAEDGGTNMTKVISDIGTALHVDGIRVNTPLATLYQNTGPYTTKLENISVYTGNLYQLLGTYDSGSILEVDYGLTSHDTLPTGPNIKIRPTPTTSGAGIGGIFPQWIDTTTGYQLQRSDNQEPYLLLNLTNSSTGPNYGFSDLDVTRVLSNIFLTQVQQAFIWHGYDTSDFTCLGVPGNYAGTGAENTTCQFNVRQGGLVSATNYGIGSTMGFTGTKTAGSCTLTIQGGIITNVTGC